MKGLCNYKRPEVRVTELKSLLNESMESRSGRVEVLTMRGTWNYSFDCKSWKCKPCWRQAEKENLIKSVWETRYRPYLCCASRSTQIPSNAEKEMYKRLLSRNARRYSKGDEVVRGRCSLQKRLDEQHQQVFKDRSYAPAPHSCRLPFLWISRNPLQDENGFQVGKRVTSFLVPETHQ